ncbi:MAG: hypothetical protein HQ543_09395 [Bacteroidetes bacterium]|nr:hypothetical protein [Bacteroidota bacterium]
MGKALATILKNTKSILVVFLALSLLWGCGPSYEEKQEQKEVARKEAAEKKRAEEKQLLSHLSGTYDVVHFPPSDFTDSIFTYELQEFFGSQKDNSIAFRGYIEDLEKVNGKIYIEFSCIVSNEIYIEPAVLLFRLEVTEKQANAFISNERPSSIDRLIGFFRDPDYLVVAKINDISKIKKYEVSGSVAGDEGEVEIEIETPLKFIGSGALIEAVKLPKNR